MAPLAQDMLKPRTLIPTRDSVYKAVFKTAFTYLGGVTFGDWRRVLRDNGYAVDPPYWPRAAILTGTSLCNSLYRRWEDHKYGAQLDAVTLQPPLFILGHWRSGTTLLHNLLALDERFTYPNLYQVMHPHTFLTTERLYSRLVRPLLPRTRILDNMAQGVDMPNEDEFAICAASLCSPYMSWSFPRARARYDRYLTFRDVPAEEIARWQEALVRFLKKLTLRCNRSVLLKSPPHTARIRLLLDLFPQARFVHIRRNPYVVFQSMKRATTLLLRAVPFQRADLAAIDDAIIAQYRAMHDAFFAQRDLVPAGQFHEVAFEDLEVDPVGQVRLIYERLGLPGFDALAPRLEAYAAGLTGYRKNEHATLPPPLRKRLGREWRRCFEEWGYPLEENAYVAV